MLQRILIHAILATIFLPCITLAGSSRPELGPLSMAIAAWVAEATGLPMPAATPDIRFVAPNDMPGLMDAAARSPASPGTADIVAFYSTPARTIYLPIGWTGSTPAELSVLVHEMVHHAQAEAGHRFACPAERERQAYDAQTRWLAQFDTDLIREFGINQMFLLIATTCGMP